MEDRIERECYISGPIHDVWRALTTPEQLIQWFGNDAEIDLRPGGAAMFCFPEDGQYFAVIEVAEAPHRFSWRWSLDPETPVGACPVARVSFQLDTEGDGTRVHLTETGFAALPEERYSHYVDDHLSGWDLELGDLTAFVQGELKPSDL